MPFCCCGRCRMPLGPIRPAFLPSPAEPRSSQLPGVMGDEPVVVPESNSENEVTAARHLSVFGSSEYAKVVLGGIWGQPPPLDLDAEAELHGLLGILADRGLLRSARDLSDGGITVALAQAAFEKGIGAKVEQEKSLMAYPLFGLFAEPASTMLLSAAAKNAGAIAELAEEYGFFCARIGTTGGDRLEISVYSDVLVSAPLRELRDPWASALEGALHDEVTA